MRMNHRAPDILMTEEFLDRPNLVAVVEEVRSERVATFLVTAVAASQRQENIILRNERISSTFPGHKNAGFPTMWVVRVATEFSCPKRTGVVKRACFHRREYESFGDFGAERGKLCLTGRGDFGGHAGLTAGLSFRKTFCTNRIYSDAIAAKWRVISWRKKGGIGVRYRLLAPRSQPSS